MTLPLVSAHDRSPDWKWMRIQGILKYGEIAATAEWDTPKGFYWISRGIDFMRSYTADPDPATNRDLLIKYADIFAAYRIYNEDDSYLRYELEATVMARVPSEEIALNANLTTAAMKAYEELFFDVRDMLDKDTYIRNFVIGKELQMLTKFNLGTIWKLYGYYYGPAMLRAIVSRTATPQFVQTPDAVASSLNEDISGSFKIACAVASKHPACGERDTQYLISLFAKFAEIDKMEDMSSGSHAGQAKEHIAAMFENLSFTIGGIVPQSNETSPMYSYKDYAADPNIAELAAISVKGGSETFINSDEFKYPPIPKKTFEGNP